MAWQNDLSIRSGFSLESRCWAYVFAMKTVTQNLIVITTKQSFTFFGRNNMFFPPPLQLSHKARFSDRSFKGTFIVRKKKFDKSHRRSLRSEWKFAWGTVDILVTPFWPSVKCFLPVRSVGPPDKSNFVLSVSCTGVSCVGGKEWTKN